MPDTAARSDSSAPSTGLVFAWAIIGTLLAAWLARDMLAMWLAAPQLESSMLRLPARVALKAGQMAVPSLLAIGAVLFAFSPSKAGARAPGKAVALLLLWLVSVTLGARLGNLGADSIRELFSANAQEARDFLWGFVAAPAYPTLDILSSTAPAFALALSQAIPLLRLKLGEGPHTAVATGAVLTIPIAIGLASLWRGELIDQRLDREFSQQAQALASAATAVGDPVNVVLVIGESVAALHQSLLAYPRPTNAALDPYRKDLVVVRDAVAPYSFTRESLIRLLSVSSDPYLDQYTSEQDLKRANLIELLNAKGFPTHWFSNQSIAGRWDFASQLFGRKAQQSLFLNFELANNIGMERRFDHELLPALRDSMASSKSPSLFVLHWYAGHHDYCRNIPADSHQRFSDVASSLSWHARFGNLQRRAREAHVRDIDCYDSAMTYVSKNLAAVIEEVQSTDRPFLVIFAADHGEDPLGGTYHDAAVTRLSHLQVPVYLYANSALQGLRPEWMANARRNADHPYATAWLSDTVVDAFGLRLPARPLQSLLAPDMKQMPRRSLLRSELLRGTTWVDIDASSDEAKDRADGPLRFRRQVANQPSDSNQQICVHRANSYYKFMLASRISNCIELDIVVAPDGPSPKVNHPPQVPSGLTLDHLLPLVSNGPRELWLDVKTSDADSLGRLKSYLGDRLPTLPSLQLLVEVEVGTDFNTRQLTALDDIRRLPRTRVLFYVPYAFAQSCKPGSPPDRCQFDLDRVDAALARGHFEDLSFDLSLLPFVQRLPSYASMRKHVWGTTALPPNASEYETIILPAPTDFER